MEQSLAPMEVLTAFLIGDWWMPWDTQDFSPSIQVSIQAWRFLLSHSTTKSSKMEYQLPIEAIEAKIPMLSAKLFPNYSIDTLWDFLSNSGPKSVKQLVTKFCLPRNLHFPIAHIYIYIHCIHENTPYSRAVSPSQNMAILFFPETQHQRYIAFLQPYPRDANLPQIHNSQQMAIRTESHIYRGSMEGSL